MRKILFLFLVFSCLSLVSAIELSENYESNIVVKEIGNPIEIQIEISEAPQGTYNLYTLADIILEPKEWFQITNGKATKEMTVKPYESLDIQGFYTFTYTLNYRDRDQKINRRMSLEFIELKDVLEITAEASEIESGEITLTIKNKKNVKLENLSATFSSLLFEEQKTFEIGPYETISFKLEANKEKLSKTKAGVYILESEFKTNKENVKISGNLYLGEREGIAVTEDSEGILIKTKTIRKINTGNILEDIEIKIEKNIISRLFTSFNIEPTITSREGLKVEYTWVKQKLEPSEIYTVKSKTNYFLPILLIGFLVLTLFGIKRYSETKLEIKKSVSPVKTKNGEFALKINLSIKAKKDLENVSLIDKVPSIVKIYKNFGMNKPDKIDTENRRIHWNIGDLNAGEERIFTYIVYSKVGVVGKFSLPEALGVFEHQGKIHETESNQVFFLSDQVRK